jgi:hypothetical protein
MLGLSECIAKVRFGARLSKRTSTVLFTQTKHEPLFHCDDNWDDNWGAPSWCVRDDAGPDQGRDAKEGDNWDDNRGDNCDCTFDDAEPAPTYRDPLRGCQRGRQLGRQLGRQPGRSLVVCS